MAVQETVTVLADTSRDPVPVGIARGAFGQEVSDSGAARSPAAGRALFRPGESRYPGPAKFVRLRVLGYEDQPGTGGEPAIVARYRQRR